MIASPVLIFCPNINGHRPNYCYVIGSWFARNGYSVKLAARRKGAGQLTNEPLLAEMRQQWGVELLEMADQPRQPRTVGDLVPELLALERSLQPAWTFIPDGEAMEVSLDGLGADSSTSPPRRAAIFPDLTHIYPPARNVDQSLFWRIYSRWLAYPQRRRMLNHWYRNKVWSRLGLTLAFTPNEDFIRRYPCDRMFYLPEICRAWGSKTKADTNYIRHLCDAYGQFLQRHPGKRVILYFGGWCVRRAYDELLRLACDEKDSVFVSCGRRVPGDENFVHDVRAFRTYLAQEGRIHEVETPFLADNAFNDMLFNSAPFVLLPYPSYLGPSGVLFQAAFYGKPVLVMDQGYMASLVRRHKIGLCCRTGDWKDFRRVYSTLISTAPNYTERVRAFSDGYTHSAVDQHLSAAFNRFI